MSNQISLLQYPPAAANAVMLLIDRDSDGRGDPARRRHPQGTALRQDARMARRCGPSALDLLRASPRSSSLFVLFLYGPMLVIDILSFQGPDGGLTFPMNGVSLHWFARLFEQQRGRRLRRLVPALDRARRDRHGTAPSSSRSRPASPSAAASAARPSLFYMRDRQPDHAVGLFVGLGIGLGFQLLGLQTGLVQLGALARSSPGRCPSAS